MLLTSLKTGNTRGLSTRAKLVEAVLRLKISDLPHSCPTLFLGSQVLMEAT